MTKPTLPEPLSEGTWRRISDALLQTQHEIRAAVNASVAKIDAAHDALRQRLAVIAIDEATPSEETEQ